MTNQQRLYQARANVQALAACTTPDTFDGRTLTLHDQVLARSDEPWLLGRLGRGGLLSDLVTGLLDLYAPLEPPTPAAAPQTTEAHA